MPAVQRRHYPQPTCVTFEITTRCNLACVMCPHGLSNGMLNKRDAPDALVESIIAQTPNLYSIHPTGVGEPMLADGFWRIVDHLAGRVQPRLTFNTNGLLLTPRNVARVMAAPLALVSVSMDAAAPETYRRIRGGDFRKVTDGIRRLSEARAALSPDPERILFMSMVLMRENIAEAAAFATLAADLGMDGIYLEHLTEPQMPAKDWVVTRDDYTFRYDEEQLFAHAAEADAAVIAALDVADARGIAVSGSEILLLPGSAAHEQRPCRARQRETLASGMM